MQKQSRLSRSVNLALTLGVASTFATQAMAQAQQEQSVEKIAVTGSRIATTVSDAPRPVTVITADAIEAAGFENVADVIRSTSYNTMGSYRESSGSSFGPIAQVNLKGLGADRTAVLINGRRVPGNPFTGSSSVDINSIPLSAVQNIEILTDSASAIYGADAIGGVINIIMKSDFDGSIIDAAIEAPSRDGADRKSVKFTTGSSNDKSSVLFSFEYTKKDHIADRDRDYSKLNVKDSDGYPIDGVDVTGANGGGNTGLTMDQSRAFIVGECDESFYMKMRNPLDVPGEGCGYIYSDISYSTMDTERYSAFVDARRDLGENHQLYFEGRLSRMESSGRFAPAIGGFLVGADAPINPVGEDFILYHRFVAHGPRDDSQDVTEMDLVAGFNGVIFDGAVDYDVSVRKYDYRGSEAGNNYVLTSNIEALVASGDYNYVDPMSSDPKHLAAIAASRATLSRDLRSDYWSVQTSFSGDLPIDLAGGAVQWAAGAEFADEEYQDIYDSYREAQNVLGSAGNSASGGRDRWAAFAETKLPVTNDFDISLAVRYDDYSDFGSEVSPQIAARYQVAEWLKVRASYGQGFKAPNLTDLYAKPQQSFEGVQDLTRCRAQGISDKDCPKAQVETYTGGNLQLAAETSESYNLGLVLEPIDKLLVSLDYYNVEIEGLVTSPEFEDLFKLEQEGNLPAGVVINRAPSSNGIPGSITLCVAEKAPNCGLINVNANLGYREVTGMDLRLQYQFDTEYGSFAPEIQWSHIAKYEDELVGTVIEREGMEEYPANRANFNLLYSIGDFAVNYRYNWIDSMEANSKGRFAAWDMHSINAIWTGIDGLEISVGVRNLTDEDPSIDDNLGWTADTGATSMKLYDIDGRVYTAGVKYSF
ncbi:TonB-dependent receptor [Bowmanella denitrificans]|uniref:TonB-dependent receptor n=1 Tax=Bowmanella denitrificans TaxID=366582 RepID=A0ABN0XJ89_9ALTE|nr:TonB-dependent receptor [Bowmanella denitrificans]